MGENNWTGLLEPLDKLLRRELIKYGELSLAAGDGFISNIYSTKYAQAKFKKDRFFDDPIMPKVGYDVTAFLHATSHNESWPLIARRPVNVPDWKEKGTWMGFVAVSDDETLATLGRRDVCIVWRGTCTGTEMAVDKDEDQRAVRDCGLSPNDLSMKVHSGFLEIYTSKDEESQSARDEVLAEVKRLVNEVYPDEEVSITLTGHSLGGALALLSGYDIMETGAHARERDGKKAHVCVMSQAGPRVGNKEFKNRVDDLGLRVLRVVNAPDSVPKVPVKEYEHVGVELQVNSGDSPYLQDPRDVELAHNLEVYIHCIDGYQGKGEEFKLETGRDIALLNKEKNALKGEYKVEASWKVDKNKGMVKKGGLWMHS